MVMRGPLCCWSSVMRSLLLLEQAPWLARLTSALAGTMTSCCASIARFCIFAVMGA